MANYLRMYRESRALTQAELAARIGASQQQIGRLEAGTRQLTQRWIRLLTQALDVSADDILFGPSGPTHETRSGDRTDQVAGAIEDLTRQLHQVRRTQEAILAMLDRDRRGGIATRRIWSARRRGGRDRNNEMRH
ncbi:MAG: helix-turn-helix transcriptional regulator [Geminicoccaceae bacterium]